MKINPDLWEVLSNPLADADLDAANVHFALAPLSAQVIGAQLSVESSQNSIRVRF